jgi:hypothetical protein
MAGGSKLASSGTRHDKGRAVVPTVMNNLNAQNVRQFLAAESDSAPSSSLVGWSSTQFCLNPMIISLLCAFHRSATSYLWRWLPATCMAVLVLPDHTAEPLLLLQDLKQGAVGRHGLCGRDVTYVKCFSGKSREIQA